jgi:hypothetical protein
MPTYARVGGAWQLVKHIYGKVSGTWREIKPGKSRAGGSWRTTHVPFYYPAGTILPMWGTVGTLPAPWAHYTSCPNTYMPIGVNSWGLGTATGSGNVTLTSSATGNHTGTVYNGFWGNGTYCQVEYCVCTTANGGHSHSTASFDPNAYIPKVMMPFVYAYADTYTKPASTLEFSSGTNLGASCNLSQINFGAWYNLAGRGGNTTNASQGDQWGAGHTRAFTAYGGHDHRGNLYYSSCISGYNMVLHLAGQGGHTHSSPIIYAGNRPQYRTLSGWWRGDNAGYGAIGTLVMTYLTSAPEGWTMYTGMADRFALITYAGAGYGGSLGGSFYPSWTGTLTALGGHTHNSAVYPYYTPISNHYHSNTLGNDAHSISDGRWWAPNLWAINWMQFTG